MGKIILSVVMALAFAASAEANVSAPVWACAVDANNMKGENVGIGFSGGTIRTADATISCKNLLTGEVSYKSGALVIDLLGVGLGYTNYKNLNIYSTIVGIASTDELYTKRWGIKAGVNFVGVEGGIIATTGFPNGVEMEVGVYGAEAKGLAVNIQGMKLRVMTQKQYKAYLKKLEEQKKKQMEHGSNR